MKYLTLLPLAGLAVAAPGWADAPVEETTTTTWGDADIADKTVTATATAEVTYCDKTHKLYSPAPKDGKCTIDVTTITKATATVTVTEGGKGGHGGYPKETVTVTVTEDCAGPTGKPDHGHGPKPGDDKKCLSDDEAATIVKNFATLLEFTSYNGTQGAPGRGYKQDVSDATLAEDFVDISDSINFMAGKPLGSVTFPNKKAFDMGQGVMQPEVITETLNTFHDCNSITWRWKLTPKIPNAWPVVGINYMELNEKKLVSKNYAEFNNGAWLQSFGRQCAINPPSKVEGDWAKRV